MASQRSVTAAGVLAAILLLGAWTSAPPAPKIRAVTQQEIVDMMLGASIQASRSSNTASMVKRVNEAWNQGKRFSMIAVEDVPEDWIAVIPTGIGGGGAWDYVGERMKKQGVPVVRDAAREAVEALSKYTGKKFNAIVRTEASSATLSAFMLATDMNLPVVDACIAGRAVPEMQQATTFLNGIPAAPAALVTRWGDTMILTKAVDDYRVEDLSRAVAVGSGGGVQMASTMMSAADLRRGVIRGSISQAILWGRTVREANEKKQDPVAALLKVANGYKLFQGTVSKADMKGERGFTWWDVELKGINKFQGHTYRVFVKNENIEAWLDGKPDAMSPDLICNLDPKTGDAMTSQGLGGYSIDAEVVMVGIPNSPMWRTPKGIEVFGPRHFGFDFDYVPIEDLQKSRKLGTN
jgi:DUF917 family protein